MPPSSQIHSRPQRQKNRPTSRFFRRLLEPLRVMVGCAINALTRSKAGKRPRHKVLLLLDEAAALGSLEPLERGVGYLRAYCTQVLIFQDMHQLKALYRRSGSHPLANPVLIAVTVLVSFLLLTGTRYETYFAGAQFVHFLLGLLFIDLLRLIG